MPITSRPKVTSPDTPLKRRDHDHDHDHLVQFYVEDTFLIDTVAQFIGSALDAGEAAVVVGTPGHRNSLMERLQAQGTDLAGQGRYIAVDAAETLEKITVDGWPNAVLFAHVVGEIIELASTRSRVPHPRVAVFGEMVALLWEQGKAEAAIRLEQLWNELAGKLSFSLLCAYPIRQCFGEEQGESFLRICAEHSGLISGGSCISLMRDEERLRITNQLQQKAQALEAETVLRRSEERFRLFIDSVQDYAIFTLDEQGVVTGWNSGAERIKGYKAREIIGRSFSCFYSEEDIQNRKPQRLLEMAAAEGRVEDEGWRVRKDGSRFWANVIITASRDEAGRLCGFTKVTRDITEKRQADEALHRINEELRNEVIERIAVQQKMKESEQSLRELSRHLLRTQDEERQRLGRELHDSVGQYLAVLKMGLDALKSDVPSEGNTSKTAQHDKVMECIELADQAIKEVRTISYLLYPPMLEEMGLRTAIPWYLEGFSKRSGIEVALDMPPNVVRLPRDVELAMFRVLQEGLTNVHRHSGSTTAHVRVLVEGEEVILEVKDSGKGIPEDLLTSSNRLPGALGVGLRGMNERLRQLGGRLQLHSNGAGTTVRAIVRCRELEPADSAFA